MNVRLLKKNILYSLKHSISENIDLYRTGNFDFLSFDSQNYIELNYEIQTSFLEEITCKKDDHMDKESCILINKVFGDLTPYMARDERLWVYLTHTLLIDYTRKRWPIPDDKEKAIKHIKTHFFINGSRGFERDNAIARLWWMGYLCKNVEGLTFEQSLASFLFMSDVRANLVERPTTSQNRTVFGSVIRKLHTSYETDQALYNREKFRSIMKELNLKGGVKLLNAFSKEKIDELLDECIIKQSN